MNLRKAIHPDCVSVSLQARDKTGIIEELISLMEKGGQIKDRKAALKAVLEREKKMSTGMHHGLAIPHGKTDTLDALVGSVGLIPEGVDFDSIDGEPCRLFILTVSPANRVGPHIQFLAAISRLLNKVSMREQLLAAQTSDELYKLLTGA